MVEYKRTLAVGDGGDIYRDGQKKTLWLDGIEGVEQELKILLSTVQGEQPFARDFGLNVFAATGGPDAVLKREIRKALMPDDRVKSVDEVLVEEDETTDKLRDRLVTVNLTLVDDESLELSDIRV